MMSFEKIENIGIIESAMRQERDSIRVPERLDKAVLAMSLEEHRFPVVPLLLKASFALVLALVLVTGYSFSYRSGIEKECRKVYASMVQAAEQKDIDKAVSFFDLEAMGMSEEKFRKNFQSFYGGFDRIQYVVKDLEVKAKGNEVLARSKYEFKASGDRGQVNYKGSDRVYFHKNGDRLTIYCWIPKNDQE